MNYRQRNQFPTSNTRDFMTIIEKHNQTMQRLNSDTAPDFQYVTAINCKSITKRLSNAGCDNILIMSPETK